MENKVTREMAEVEFDRFLELMQLDINPKRMSEEDLESFQTQQDRILGAIERGALVINDNGEAVFTPENSKTSYKNPITFEERSGGSLTAADQKKKNHDVAKMYAILAEMCGVPQKVFAGMYGRDIKICEALFALLMG